MSKLKPCPFCGGEAGIATYFGDIECFSCKSYSCSTDDWNSRAPQLSAGIWYLLYCGSSCDGRGTPIYCGRTESEEVARAHLETTKGPYSFGMVDIVTDKLITRMA